MVSPSTPAKQYSDEGGAEEADDAPSWAPFKLFDSDTYRNGKREQGKQEIALMGTHPGGKEICRSKDAERQPESCKNTGPEDPSLESGETLGHSEHECWGHEPDIKDGFDQCRRALICVSSACLERDEES